MTELLIIAVIAIVIGVAVLVRPSDAELHQAADQERRRRQREAWTSPDGRTVR